MDRIIVIGHVSEGSAIAQYLTLLKKKTCEVIVVDELPFDLHDMQRMMEIETQIPIVNYSNHLGVKAEKFSSLKGPIDAIKKKRKY